MNHRPSGLQIFSEEYAATCQTSESLNVMDDNITSKSKDISIAEAKQKSNDSGNIIPMKSSESSQKSGSRNKKNLIWKSQNFPYQVGKDGFLNKDLHYGENGWIDVKKYLPLPYDLVLMNLEEKIINGWWNGTSWEGIRLKKNDTVHFWKYLDRGEEEF
jgi:hypothetical protein